MERLLTEQMADGGWNCEQENGSTRGSFDTTINVLEGLVEYERATGANGDVAATRRRGEEYLLERRLLHRLSDGKIPQGRWLDVGFPYSWNYDVVRALDYFRNARHEPDERMTEALDIVESKRDAGGRWPLDHTYHDKLLVALGETEGSRAGGSRFGHSASFGGRDEPDDRATVPGGHIGALIGPPSCVSVPLKPPYPAPHRW